MRTTLLPATSFGFRHSTVPEGAHFPSNRSAKPTAYRRSIEFPFDFLASDPIQITTFAMCRPGPSLRTIREKNKKGKSLRLSAFANSLSAINSINFPFVLCRVSPRTRRFRSREKKDPSSVGPGVLR